MALHGPLSDRSVDSVQMTPKWSIARRPMSEAAIAIRTEVYGLELSPERFAVGAGRGRPEPDRAHRTQQRRRRTAAPGVCEGAVVGVEPVRRAESEGREAISLAIWAHGWCCASPPLAPTSDIPATTCRCFFAALSIFIWWRAGYEEQKAEQRSPERRETDSFPTGAIFSSEPRSHLRRRDDRESAFSPPRTRRSRS